MKRLATSILLSFGLSSVFASAQEFAISTQNSSQQFMIIRAGQPVAAVNVPAAKVETTAVKADWSKEEDRVDGSISKAKLEKMKGVTSALVDFLKESCLGAGAYSPTWHGEYFSGKNSPGAQLKFGMTCHFAEQSADLNITANDLQPLLDQLVVNGQHFLTMRIANATDKNTFYYTDADGSAGTAGNTRMWLVMAGNGKLPFTPVTRAAYLAEAKAELTGMIKSIEAGWKLKVPVRSAAEQEAERKAVIDQLKGMYSGADLNIRVRVYLRSYKTDEEFLKENVASETAGFRATIRLMDSLLAHLGAVELAKPAVVSAAAADFHGFEDGQTNYMLIRMNAAYFNNALSEEKPQLFLVTWRFDAANASASALDRQLTERLDGRVLQGMLGK
ncbi:MAG TPA: hypothetical protein VG101_09050 [Puia sp.]|jgi:hypothetical protein|nr:hypothetical protein [Puia sp.]